MQPQQVSLTELLDAREQRAERQKQLLAQHPGASLICLMVNIPGPVKRMASSVRVFDAGSARLTAALREAGIPLLYTETRHLKTGDEGYYLVDAAGEAVKRMTVRLEEALPYGRLLDVDVLDMPGRPIARESVGAQARGCMVCGKAGAYCASRRRHPYTEVLDAFEHLAESARAEDPQ